MGVLCASQYGGYTLNSKKLVDNIQKVKTVFAILLTILLTLSVLTAISATAASSITAASSGGETTYTITTSTETQTFTAEQCKNHVFGGFALKLVYFSYGGLFDVLSNSDVFRLENIQELSTGGSSVWGLYGSLYESIAVAGVGLALMWTLLSIIEKMSDGRMTEELVISLFAKLLLATFIILYGKDLMVSLLGFSNAVFDAFKDGVSAWTSTVDNEAICQEAMTKMKTISDGNVFTACGYIIENLLTAAVMLVCWVLACVQLIGRVLELGVRSAFMPIGVADFMTHGTHSPGMRYLKAYCGCACQGAALYVILVSGCALMNSGDIFTAIFGATTSNSDLTNVATSTGRIILNIVTAVTMLGLMKRVDNLLKEVFAS